MKTITTHDAKTHLSRYLAAAETGQEFIIARGRKPVARLGPMKKNNPRKSRPKVGDIEGAAFEFPVSAFAPLTKKDLKEWGV